VQYFFFIDMEKILKPKVAIIAAIASNNVIGNDNKLIWHLSPDLKRFKNLTMGHPVIMGRKTFESIGKPLPGRTFLILSSNENYKVEGCFVFNSLNKLFDFCKNEEKVFVIGGEKIFLQTIGIANYLYLTHIHKEFSGDAYFPKVNYNHWRITENSDHLYDDKSGLKYSFIDYENLF